MTLYPKFGTVSQATLRNEDLLKAFADELERCCKDYGGELSQYEDSIVGARCIDPDSEEASEIVNELIDMLDGFSASYSSFRSNDGDGADFGFWPDIEALERAVVDKEVFRISDTSEVEFAGEFMLVNDHGNVTYGYATDDLKFIAVWDCV